MISKHIFLQQHFNLFKLLVRRSLAHPVSDSYFLGFNSKSSSASDHLEETLERTPTIWFKNKQHLFTVVSVWYWDTSVSGLTDDENSMKLTSKRNWTTFCWILLFCVNKTLWSSTVLHFKKWDMVETLWFLEKPEKKWVRECESGASTDALVGLRVFINETMTPQDNVLLWIWIKGSKLFWPLQQPIQSLTLDHSEMKISQPHSALQKHQGPCKRKWERRERKRIVHIWRKKCKPGKKVHSEIMFSPNSVFSVPGSSSL